MSVWLIEPRDPLIFRDGRPFNPTPGARAKSLPFPYPSTLAGAVRTRAGQDAKGVFDKGRIDQLLQLGIHGPVLVEMSRAEGWYFPAPADCLVIQAKDKPDEKDGKRLWVRPVELEEDEGTNLQDGLAPISVLPVRKDKAHPQAIRFWKWERLKEWLENPANDEQPLDPAELGIPGLTAESRIHVKIQAERQTAEEGMLFETGGLEFALMQEAGRESKGKESREKTKLVEFALAVDTDAELKPGVDFLGGERRLVNWREGSKFPACPEEIAQNISTAKACRLLLATPALFENGYLPRWIETCSSGVTVQVVAAAVPRYQAVSGWDYKENQPKASRRLAPAGSVYFLRLTGDDAAIGQFIENTWLHNISDAEHDRRDGFGLALLGVWDGKIERLRLEDEK